MRSNTIIGIALGTVVGLLIDALMLLFLNEWLVVLIWPLLLPLAVGIALGIFVIRKLPTLNWWYLIGVIVIGYFLVGAPYEFVHWRLVSIADALPVYPGAELTNRMVMEGCSDNNAPWVSSTYHVNAPADKVREYMTQEFSKTWRKDTGIGDVFYSPSETERVAIHADQDSSLGIYLEVFKFCGKR